MRIIDISLPLGTGTPVYPGDPPVRVTRLSEADGGGSYALSRLTLGTHSGTHIDPPAHLIPGGSTVDQLDLSACIGPAFVLGLSGDGLIAPADLDAVPDGTERLLLRTGGPPIGGRALGAEAASRLVQRGLRLVGIDSLSVEPADTPGTVHHLLLGADIVILEGLELALAPTGPSTLICLPLRIAGGDGAPARALLITGD